MDLSLLPKTLGGMLATLSTFVLGFLMWRIQVTKGRADESATVLSAWKQMVEAHQAQIASMRDDFAAYKKTAVEELCAVRNRLDKAEQRIRELEDENAGLRRIIIQNNRSTVMALHSHDFDEVIQRLDRGEGP